MSSSIRRTFVCGSSLALLLLVSSITAEAAPEQAWPDCSENNTAEAAVCLRKGFHYALARAHQEKWDLPITPDLELLWQQRVAAMWNDPQYNTSLSIKVPQTVVVVDANIHVQKIAIMVALPNQPWVLIGLSKVSTGQPERKEHFLTPPGIYVHDGQIMDYRALGTKNKNGIMGIGKQHSRIWDFGWQWAQAGWTKQDHVQQIRLMLHATDPKYIEPRLGSPASKGCIHIADGVNAFLDHYSTLDLGYLQMLAYWQQTDDGQTLLGATPPHSEVAIEALLKPDRNPTLPGDIMIVTDAGLGSSMPEGAVGEHTSPPEL